MDESVRTGFHTDKEDHPSELVESGQMGDGVGIQELKAVIPQHCFAPSLAKSATYLIRDLVYSITLLTAYRHLIAWPVIWQTPTLYYSISVAYGAAQGIVWTGLWVIAHDCGHSAFSNHAVINDSIGFVLHSFLLAPYFSWKSTHRRHHIYANHIDKDLHYVPPRRDDYATKIGSTVEKLDELGEDAPVILFMRIMLQQVIGWNWYIISNITCPPTATVKRNMSQWRHSHFDPWGAIFRDSEVAAVILSDIGCMTTIAGLYASSYCDGGWGQVLWQYIVPWCWVNQWIVMITFLHHTHPSVPKYTNDSWTFVKGATATIDRDFGIIGTHFFHHISSDHVTHHLFPKIPHYYSRDATNAIVPLLGKEYHGRTTFSYADLKQSFRDCQWVEEDQKKDRELRPALSKEVQKEHRALWYRKGRSPPPEFKMRVAGMAIASMT